MSERRRAGSVASSQRSKNAERGGATAAGQVKSAPDSQATPPPKQRRRGFSRFLVVLNCCGMHERGTPVETEDASRPVKQETLTESAQGRQSVPLGRQDASAAESSTAESKELIEEKSVGPPYTGTLSPAAVSKVVDNTAVDTAGMEKPRIGEEPEVIMNPLAEDLDEGNKPRDPPLPPLPDSTDPVSTNEPAPEGPSQLSDIQVLVQAPTPIVSQDEQEQISDRTSQQERRDSDIEMTDAPPSVPTPGESVATADNVRDEPKVDLPPPPPLVEVNRPAGPIQNTTAAATSNEEKQWLLPPIQPRFRGKKCLVLDLDETLVHSSFKVRPELPDFSNAWKIDPLPRSFTKQISRFLWKSKASIITFT